MTDFITADITTDPTVLLDSSIDQMNTSLNSVGYPDWTASDATLAVILLGTICLIAADVAQVAATVVPAIFRAFGTQLLGIPYENGSPASVLSTWTFNTPAPAAGYTIPGRTGVYIQDSLFDVPADVFAASGSTSAVVELVSDSPGAIYNNLGGVGYGTTPYSEIDWVESVDLFGSTSGGADQQTDADYQNSIVEVLSLMAARPVTATDFAGMVVSDYAISATGITVGRATSIDDYYPDARQLSTGGTGSTVLSCTTANSSPTVSFAAICTTQVPTIGTTVTGTHIPADTYVAASPAPTESTFALVDGTGAPVNATGSGTVNLTFGLMSGYGPQHLTASVTTTISSPTVTLVTPPYYAAIPDVGARVLGTNIPAGTTVLGYPAPTVSGFTMSHNATSNATETVTISSWTQIARCVTTYAHDTSGNALTTANMDALVTWLQTKRESTFLAFINPPSYNLVYVMTSIHVLPGFDPVTTATNVQSALLGYLSPLQWANPYTLSSGAQGWLNIASGFNIVRYNKVLGLIESVTGVDYVEAGSNGLSIGFSIVGSSTADLTLTGPAPLATSTPGLVNGVGSVTGSIVVNLV